MHLPWSGKVPGAVVLTLGCTPNHLGIPKPGGHLELLWHSSRLWLGHKENLGLLARLLTVSHCGERGNQRVSGAPSSPRKSLYLEVLGEFDGPLLVSSLCHL